jgi:hypothetical protein
MHLKKLINSIWGRKKGKKRTQTEAILPWETELRHL